MGQVIVSYTKPTYNVLVKVAQELSKPADAVAGENPEKSVMNQSQDSSAIKKEEIHKMIDDQRKTVEKLSVEESSDGTQKVTILVKPTPILRKNPEMPQGQQQPMGVQPPAAPSANVTQMPAPAAAPAAKAASKYPVAFIQAMGL